MVNNNRIERLWQHWCLPSWRIKKWFPQTTLTRLERGIGESEAQHMGQIRFVIESNMETMAVLQGVTPRQRARQYFGSLEVWDTAYNTGVLLYVSCADRAIEIVADRGISQKVDASVWHDICQTLGKAFAEEMYQQGLEAALQQMTAVLISHIPRVEGRVVTDDLSNEIVLR